MNSEIDKNYEAGVVRRDRLLVTLLALLLCGFLVAAIQGTAMRFVPIPFWDEWDGNVFIVTQLDRGLYRYLLQRHVDHITLLTNLLFFVNFRLFGGSLATLVAANLMLVAVICAQLRFITVKILVDGSRKLHTTLATLITCALMFSWMQHENLTWGFQSQMYFACILPLAAFTCAYLATESTPFSSIKFSMAVLLAALSVGTMANGVLALPILLFLIRRYGFSLWHQLLVVVVTTAVYAYFFQGYAPATSQNGGLALLRKDPLGILAYFLGVLGAPFALMFPAPKINVAIGAGAVVASLLLWAILNGLRHRQARAEHVLLAMMLYGVLTAMATAVGRLPNGIGTALSSRYTTCMLLTWACLFLYGLHFARSRLPPVSRRVLLIGILTIVLLIPQQFRAFKYVPDYRFEKLVAGLSIAMRVFDQTQIDYVFPWVEAVFILSDEAYAKGILTFSQSRFAAIRERIAQPAGDSGKLGCAIALDDKEIVIEDKRFVRISGYYQVAEKGEVPLSFDVIDAQHRVIGRVISNPYEVPVYSEQDKRGGFNTQLRGYKLAGLTATRFDAVEESGSGARMSCTAT